MRSRPARALSLLLAAALAWSSVALLARTSAARADGDPASDVLLGENVFYPYSPPTSAANQKALNGATAAAARSGLPIKVALIGSPVDLGVIPDLFGKPQQYAAFLDQEISFHSKQPLLVVMAAGYGVQGLPPAVTDAATTLRKPAGTTPDALAVAAITAVAKIAAAAGHPLKGVAGVSGASNGSSAAGSGRTILVVVLVLAAVATATALVVVRRRQGAGAR